MATDEANHIGELVNKLIPDGRRALQDSYRNLAELGNYCEQSYLNAEDANGKKSALDDSKQYAVQSLASVAYQVNAMAARTLELFDLHSSQLSTLESTIHHISQTIDIHKEKVARREIGSLAANKRNTRVHKITLPNKEDRGVRYMRINYNLNTLDSVGHGVHVPEPEDFMHKKRALTAPSEPDGPSPAVVQQEQMQRDRITRQRGESIRSMGTRYTNTGRMTGPDVPAPVAPMVPGGMRGSFDQYDAPPPAPPTIPPSYSGSRLVQEHPSYNHDTPPHPAGPPPPPLAAGPPPPMPKAPSSSFAGPPPPPMSHEQPPPPPSMVGGPIPPPPMGDVPPPPMGGPPPPAPPPLATAPQSGSLSPPIVSGSLADQLKARSGELSPPMKREHENPPAPSTNFQEQLAQAVKLPGQGRRKAAMHNQKSIPAAGPPPSTPPPRPPSPPEDPAPPPPPPVPVDDLPPPMSLPTGNGKLAADDSAPPSGLRQAGPLDPPWAPREFIEKAVTIYGYDQDRTDELSFEEGELIYIVKKNLDEWFEGVKEPGTRGLFPGNYVQTLDT